MKGGNNPMGIWEYWVHFWPSSLKREFNKTEQAQKNVIGDILCLMRNSQRNWDYLIRKTLKGTYPMFKCLFCGSVKGGINFFFYTGNYSLSSVSITRLKQLIKSAMTFNFPTSKGTSLPLINRCHGIPYTALCLLATLPCSPRVQFTLISLS